MASLHRHLHRRPHVPPIVDAVRVPLPVAVRSERFASRAAEAGR
jgi:hypothetical protein